MTISIVNHKGGTGKTTTAVNMGSALALDGFKVLLVDFDAQASLTYSLGIEGASNTLSSVLFGELPVHEIIHTREGMDILPADSSLADAELAMAMADDRFFHLRRLLDGMRGYDFILIDCPPSLSLLTLNALVASDYLIVPMHMDVLSLRGLGSMEEMVGKVKNMNPRLRMLGVLPVMVDTRKNMHQEILGLIASNYDVPMFRQSIRPSVRAAEAPSFGKSVVTYAPTSTTAMDYRKLVAEVLDILNKTQLTPTNR